MRLELASFAVSRVGFVSDSREAGLRGGVLSIDRAGLLRELRADHRLEAVDLDLVRPGEDARLLGLHDVIEPRVKVDGPGHVFPGVASRPLMTVGAGRTHRVAGVGVAACGPGLTAFGGAPGWHESLAFYLDMRGPAALPPFADLLLVCVLAVPRADLPTRERAQAVWDAALKASLHLADLTRGASPDAVDVYETPAVAASLPGVVYLPLFSSPEHYGGSVDAFGTSIYGLTRLTPPLWLHPNEMHDGAVGRCGTWIHQNHPIVADLYRAHGDSLAFRGVIVQRTRWTSEPQKRWTAQQTAKMARMLGATGAIVTWDYGGNDFLEVAYTIEACEAAGIKTVWVTVEQEKAGNPGSLLFMPPTADAVVSTGGLLLRDVPPPGRVVGFDDGALPPGVVAEGDQIRSVFGEFDFYGLRNRSRVDF